MTTWVILGAGGHGRSVADAIQACGHELLGFLDDKVPPSELVAGAPVLGPLALAWEWPQLPRLNTAPDCLVVALGNPSLRHTWQQVLERQSAAVGVVVHPRTWVSPSAQLSPGCVVLAGAVVNANAVLHRGVLVNSGAVAWSTMTPSAAPTASSASMLRWQAAHASGLLRLSLPVMFSAAGKAVVPSCSWLQALRISARA